MTAQDVVVIGWKLAAALVAGIPITSVIGVWVIARFTTAFDAYAGERAKLQVQFDNVQKLIEQTKALTEATESIKAKLSEDIWGRQQKWLKRLDAYLELANAFDELQTACFLILHSAERIRNAVGYKGDQDLPVDGAERFQNALLALKRLHPLVSMVGSRDVLKILMRFTSLPGHPALEKTARSTIESLDGIQDQLTVAARTDLGYEPLS